MLCGPIDFKGRLRRIAKVQIREQQRDSGEHRGLMDTNFLQVDARALRLCACWAARAHARLPCRKAWR